MKNSRRQFIKIGGLTIIGTGIVPALISGCKNEKREDANDAVFNNMVNGVVPPDTADYSLRVENARRSLSDNKIDAIFIEGGTNLKYFFNVTWWLSERVFGAIIPARGNAVWICPAFETERVRELIPEGEKIYAWQEHESPYKLMRTIVADLGISTGKLAMCPNVRSFVLEGFIRDAGAQIVDGSVITESCRAIKTEKEIGYMDLANRITKLSLKYIFGKIHEGMTHEELGSLCSDAHSQMGVSGGGGIGFGLVSAFPHGSSKKKNLVKGDVVLIDAGCGVEGYRSDVTRSIIFGKPTDRQKQVFEVVLRAQQAAFNAIRPGVACGDIDLAARKVMEDAGFGPGYKYFTHRLGHGIGLDVHEYPYLVKDNPLIIKTGMTFTNEPGIYIYDEFGIRIEDSFVVREDGPSVLGGMKTEAIDMPFGA
jgi:Xaa-Pro dipeptidase